MRSLLAPRRRARVFLSICALAFLVNYGRVAFAPLVDHFIQTGTTPALAGLAATAVWLGSALPRLPTGYLLTFMTRYRVLIGVCGWLAIAAGFTAAAPGIWFIIVGAFGIGLATGAYFIAANPLVSELYPDNVGFAIGIRGMFSQLAAVAAPFLVAVSILLGSWRYGFVGMALATVVVIVLLVMSVSRTKLPTVGMQDRDLIGGIRQGWRLVIVGIAFVGLTGFVWQGVFNFYVTYLGAEKGITPGTATTLLTIMFAAGVPSFIIGGRLADRISILWLLISVLAGFVVSLYLLTIVNGLLAILLISIVMGFIIHFLFPVGDAYLLASLPDSHRASAYAGFSASMMLIQAPGSVAVGILAQYGIAYGTILQTYAIAIGVLTVVMALLAIFDRLPHGGQTGA